MRIFAVSDIHLDYKENQIWLDNLSFNDYQDDILILAGDVSDSLRILDSAFKTLRSRFREVLYVPGNHELWVLRDRNVNSFDKFIGVIEIASNRGILTKPFHCGSLSIVPLMGWYDYSLGPPSLDLKKKWMDYVACRWPGGLTEEEITRYFISMNEEHLGVENEIIISFSHFMPTINIMPSFIPPDKKILYPVLGTSLLEKQIRMLGSDIHIYGHSHVNMEVHKDGTLYLNNAFGYPHETYITRKKLVCVYESNNS